MERIKREYRLGSKDYPVQYKKEEQKSLLNPIEVVSDGLAEVNNGFIQSTGYVRGKRGWRLLDDGTAEFQNVKIGQRIITADSTKDLNAILADLEREGGGIIQLKAGTYNIGSTVNIPSFVEIRGENKYTTILNFGGTSANVTIAGANAYTTGTVSITSGTTVTGSGTSWLTNAVAGQQIFLDNRWYLIANVASNTSITLAESYGGAPLSGATYRIATVKRDIELSELTITGSTSTGLAISDLRNIIIEDVLCYGNGAGGASFTNVSEIRTSRLFGTGNTTYGVKFNKCSIGDVADTLADGNTTNGMTIDDVKYILFPGGSISGNTADGINITTGQNLLFFGLTIATNGGQGVEMVSGNNIIVFEGCAISANTSDGLKLTATSDGCILNGNSYSYNGGYGLNISASTCDDNIVTASYFSTNTSGAISDSGTGTIKEANSPASLNAGTNKVAGSILYSSANTERTSSATSYTSIKSFTVGMGGQYRIKFDLRIQIGGIGDTAYGRIYKNGVALGTEQTDTSGTYSTKTEDLATFSPGDVIALYVKTSNAGNLCVVKNFQLYVSQYDGISATTD